MNRRRFLRRTTLFAGGIVTATTLQALAVHCAYTSEHQPGNRARGNGYGRLRPVADQNGQRILALPDDFQYTTFSRTGDPMSDGFATPAFHDGMSAFTGQDGTIRLIRNHEIRNAARDFAFAVAGPAATRYDALAGGGCTTIDYDPKHRRIVRDFISINGTLVNCSGGRAYNDIGWITSEETIGGPENGYGKKHGYNFLVRADSNAPEPAVALTAMGRFAHEAAVADPGSGIVYQTEDSGSNSGFYRFLPNDPENLVAGGVLQMAKICGVNGFDTSTRQTAGVELAVEWVTIDDADPDPISSSTSCFAQGFARGGARWARLEGIVCGEDGRIFFVSTCGGNAARGQLWQYAPDSSGGGYVVLLFESPNSRVLDSPDNLCVTPSGDILFCEDDASGDSDTHALAPEITDVNRLVGMGRNGEPFEFAVNIFSGSEFAGACFSPDGEILFVNIQGENSIASGMTCAITGPWHRRVL